MTALGEDHLMFDRYTDRARRAVALADQEAGRMLHDSVDTGHLLLGLLGEGEAVAFRAIDALGVTLETARAAVVQQRPCGDTHSTAARPFTPQLKKALELALRESLLLGHNFIGTEHLLLGLIREGDGTATTALVAIGRSGNRPDLPADVRAKVLELLRGYAETARERNQAEAAEPVIVPGDGPRISALFASWAQEEGILARVTGEQCADLAKAFMYGYACGAGTVAGDARAAALLRTGR